MSIKIDKGIPIAPHGCTKYPFEAMEIGNSFRAPVEKRLSSAAYHYGKKSSKKFKTRTVLEDGKKWTRVWRVA